MKHYLPDRIGSFLTLFFLVAGFPVALSWGIVSTIADQANEAALSEHLKEVGKVLSQTISLASPQEALQRSLQKLSRHPFPSPGFLGAASELSRKHPHTIELFLADPKGKPMSAEGFGLAPRVALEGIIQQLTTGIVPSNTRFIESFIGPNRLVRRLSLMEKRLLVLQAGPARNWGFWARLRDSNRLTTGYLVAFVRTQEINDSRFLRDSVDESQKQFGRHFRLGWLDHSDPTDPDRLYPTPQPWPAGLANCLRKIPWGLNKFAFGSFLGKRQFAQNGEIVFSLAAKQGLLPVWPQQLKIVLQIWLLVGVIGVGVGTFYLQPRWGLRPKLIALLGTGAGIPLFVLLCTGFIDRQIKEQNVLAEFEREQEECLNQIDRDLHESMSSLMSAYRNQKKQISAGIISGSGIPQELTDLLNRHKHLLSHASIVSSSGAILFHEDFDPNSTPGSTSLGRDVMKSLLFQLMQRHNGDLAATGTMVTEDPLSVITGGTLMSLWKRLLLNADQLQNVNMLNNVLPSFIAPILDDQGHGIAMIAVMHLRRELQVEFLRTFFRRRPRPGLLEPRLFAVPVDEGKPWPVFPSSNLLNLKGLEEQVVLTKKTRLPNHQLAEWRGRKYLVSLVPGQNLDGYVLGSAQPLDALTEQTRQLAARLSALALSALTLALSGAWLASRLLLRPVQNLGAGLARLQQRIFKQPVPSALVEDMSLIGSRLNRHFEDLQDLQVARSVQEQLWPPEELSGPGWSLSGQCRTAADLGGNHHDWLKRPDGKICLAIGNVAGHGIPAALVAAAAKVFLCLLAEREDDPGVILHGINLRFLEQVQKGTAMTMWLGLFDPASRILRFANAGHTLPVLCQGNQPYRLLGQPGLPLGINDQFMVLTEEVRLLEKSLLCLFTDGLPEACNQFHGAYTLPRVHELISQQRGLASHEMFEAIFKETASWSGNETPHDDQTLIILNVEQSS